MPLKIALLEAENRGQRASEIADLAKIHETRLSQIVRYRVTPTESEKLRLAGVLQKPVDELFATESAVTE